MKYKFPKKFYESKETLSDNLDVFKTSNKEEQKLVELLAGLILNQFLSKRKPTRRMEKEITTWIGKHVPISNSTSSNLIPHPILLRNSEPHHLVSTFITILEGLATQNKAQIKLIFIEVETTINQLLCGILEQLNPRPKVKEMASVFADECIADCEE